MTSLMHQAMYRANAFLLLKYSDRKTLIKIFQLHWIGHIPSSRATCPPLLTILQNHQLSSLSSLQHAAHFSLWLRCACLRLMCCNFHAGFVFIYSAWGIRVLSTPGRTNFKWFFPSQKSSPQPNESGCVFAKWNPARHLSPQWLKAERKRCCHITACSGCRVSYPAPICVTVATDQATQARHPSPSTTSLLWQRTRRRSQAVGVSF